MKFHCNGQKQNLSSIWEILFILKAAKIRYFLFPIECSKTQDFLYQGQVVGIQKVHKTSITVNANIIKEFKTVRELSHENINPVYGACPEPNNILIVSGKYWELVVTTGS